jgi:threonine aldolase
LRGAIAVIDLRSDTVTLPSPEMRAAMARAELGDDVYGEDPSVNQLERLAAEMLGKEAAIFVPTGTMGNMCAHLAHTVAGQEVICGERSHTLLAEAAGPARIGGLSLWPLPQDGAIIDARRVEAAIRPLDVHCPKTGLIWVEQPCSGYVMPLDRLRAIAEVGRRRGIPVHMDGARIFNAALALGVPARTIAGEVDSVMFCLSKGLAAPVGSLLVGSAAVIDRARHARKMLGGGMRQAGVLAAAGVYALEQMVDRLQEDHDNARRLAAGLRRLPGVRVDREEVETNIFFFDLVSDQLRPRDLTAGLKERGILVSSPYGEGRRMRLVTHYGITSDDIEQTLGAFGSLLP